MPEVNVCSVNCAINSTKPEELLARLAGEKKQFPHEPREWTALERENAATFEQVLSRYPMTQSGHFRCKYCGSLF